VVDFVVLEVVVLLGQQKAGACDSDDTQNLIYTFSIWQLVAALMITLGMDHSDTSRCKPFIQELRVLHLYFDVLCCVLGCQSRSIVWSETNCCFCFLLSIRLVLKCFDSGKNMLGAKSRREHSHRLPPLVCASLSVDHHAMLAFKPFCTFDTIKPSQTR
jgi:hypothetical protein